MKQHPPTEQEDKARPLSGELKRTEAVAVAAARAGENGREAAAGPDEVREKALEMEPAGKTQTRERRQTMPGFNRQGPDFQGPMTGKRQGPCMTGQAAYQEISEGYGYENMGFGRRCGRGRGPGAGMGNRSWGRHLTAPAQADPEGRLRARREQLEKELKAIKRELDAMPDNV